MVKIWSDTVTQFYGIRLICYECYRILCVCVELADRYIFLLFVFDLSLFLRAARCFSVMLIAIAFHVPFIRSHLIPIEWYSKHVLIH